MCKRKMGVDKKIKLRSWSTFFDKKVLGSIFYCPLCFCFVRSPAPDVHFGKPRSHNTLNFLNF